MAKDDMVVSDDTAHVESIDSLECLSSSMESFRFTGREVAKQLRIGARAKLDTAYELVSSCRRALAGAMMSLEDGNTANSELIDKLESDLDKAQGYRDAVELRVLSLEKVVCQLDSILEGSFNEAIRFLCEKVEILRAIDVGLDRCLDDSLSLVGRSTPNSISFDSHHLAQMMPTNLIPIEIYEMETIPLPSGFQWVPISELETSDMLEHGDGGLRQFKKVSYEIMIDGANRFRQRILPSLKIGIKESSTWRESDLRQGLDYEHGDQRVYEAFLSQVDCIYVCRSLGSNRYQVISGRHRIRVAADLGWKVVPAKVKDLII